MEVYSPAKNATRGSSPGKRQMAKSETIFTCEKCDAQYPKWTGRCVQCGAWSTIKESAALAVTMAPIPLATAAVPVSFASVSSEGNNRTPTGIHEVDRVLGGGIVPGSVLLLAGEPGNGKSTLAAQIAHSCHPRPDVTPTKVGVHTLDSRVRGNDSAGGNDKVLYVSGEESAEQVKLRLDRLGVNLGRLSFLGQTDARVVAATITAQRPALTIIDSIQTMRVAEASGEPGSLGQVLAAAAVLTEAAKFSRVRMMMIGQVTKDGSTAGPKSLEHLVDVVLTLEGDRESQYRILRAEKNRFGATDEIGVFVMHERGLKEVTNPSELFVRERSRLPGSCMTCVLEGSRAMLVEVQALAHPSAYSTPVRRASGIDTNRLQMICAVLASRAKLPLGKADVHVNVVGGIRLREPAADLAIALAIASTIKNKPLDAQVCAFGELGLGGEIRTVRGSDRRITEAVRFGLKRVIAPPDARLISDALNQGIK